MKTPALALLILMLLWGSAHGWTAVDSEALLDRMETAYQKVQEYETRLVITGFGKDDAFRSRQELVYRFKKPNRLRIDFITPHAGMTILSAAALGMGLGLHTAPGTAQFAAGDLPGAADRPDTPWGPHRQHPPHPHRHVPGRAGSPGNARSDCAECLVGQYVPERSPDALPLHHRQPALASGERDRDGAERGLAPHGGLSKHQNQSGTLRGLVRPSGSRPRLTQPAVALHSRQ